MSTKKTLIASAIALGLGLGGQAFAAENTENGAGENLQVESERAPPYILDIQVELLAHRQLAAPTGLPQAGDAGQHLEAHPVGRGEQLRLPFEHRTGADQ